MVCLRHQLHEVGFGELLETLWVVQQKGLRKHQQNHQHMGHFSFELGRICNMIGLFYRSIRGMLWHELRRDMVTFHLAIILYTSFWGTLIFLVGDWSSTGWPPGEVQPPLAITWYKSIGLCNHHPMIAETNLLLHLYHYILWSHFLVSKKSCFLVLTTKLHIYIALTCVCHHLVGQLTTTYHLLILLRLTLQ